MEKGQRNVTAMVDLERAAEAILAEVSKSEAFAGAAVFALHGDLGAGKTTFVQSFARLLGIDESVTSPTFVIMKKYTITNSRWNNMIHIDAYRLSTASEMEVLGLVDELGRGENIIFIEWAEKVVDLLPKETINIYFTLKGQERSLEIK